MHGNSVHGNQEVPVAPAVLRKRRAGRGTHKDTPFAHVAGKSDHCVVPEKAPNKRRKVCGGAGGKAMDQGEPHGGTHGPDADRDTRVPVSPWGAGSRVSAASRQVSEIRAVCVSSACTDLCGGCRVTGIPTATRSGSILRALAPGLASPAQILLILLKRQGPSGSSRLRHG